MPDSRIFIIIGTAIALWWLVASRLGAPEPLNAPEAIVAAVRPGDASSECRPTAAELAATEMAGPAVAASASTPVTYPVVTTELAVLAGDRDVPRLFPSLIVRAPAETHPDLIALLAAPIASVDPGQKQSGAGLEAQNAFRMALEETLANVTEDPGDFGVFNSSNRPRGPIIPFSFPGRDLKSDEALLEEVLALSEPPLVSLEDDGTFTIVVPKGPRTLSDHKETRVGGWYVSSDGRYLHLRIRGRPPASTAWYVRVCAEGLPISREACRTCRRRRLRWCERGLPGCPALRRRVLPPRSLSRPPQFARPPRQRRPPRYRPPRLPRRRRL